MVIPAHPLALTKSRQLDERRQRALTRYYAAAGAGGIAVGVHTTQFAIREAGLYEAVLELASEAAPGRMIRIAGIVGPTRQALAEARIARELEYDAGLLSLGALHGAPLPELIRHARAVAEVIPLFGFYLQPAVGGRELDVDFWRRFVQIENVVAIKIAPFDRYRTIDVVRAVAESGRSGEIALYTGNDDNIVGDLVTPFAFGPGKPLRMAGGLLGHWALWTKRAVEQLKACRQVRAAIPADLLALGAQITDANAAVFDAANGFAGCIPGIHEVLRRQGLLAGTWTLDPGEVLSPGQKAAIDRVCSAYPHLSDDDFVREHIDTWLR